MPSLPQDTDVRVRFLCRLTCLVRGLTRLRRRCFIRFLPWASRGSTKWSDLTRLIGRAGETNSFSSVHRFLGLTGDSTTSGEGLGLGGTGGSMKGESFRAVMVWMCNGMRNGIVTTSSTLYKTCIQIGRNLCVIRIQFLLVVCTEILHGAFSSVIREDSRLSTNDPNTLESSNSSPKTLQPSNSSPPNAPSPQVFSTNAPPTLQRSNAPPTLQRSNAPPVLHQRSNTRMLQHSKMLHRSTD